MRTSLAYALAADALEPGDALALRRAAARPGGAARLDHAARALGAEPSGAGPTGGPWLLGDTGRISLGGLHLDAGPWRPGDRLPLLLDAGLPGDARVGVTVHTRAGARVLSPVDGRWVRVEQLRLAEDGRRALDLVLDETPGLHRVLVEVRAATDEAVLARAEVAVRVVAG